MIDEQFRVRVRDIIGQVKHDYEMKGIDFKMRARYAYSSKNTLKIKVERLLLEGQRKPGMIIGITYVYPVIEGKEEILLSKLSDDLKSKIDDIQLSRG